ncbi:MAG: type II toxin-antitoxin system antitoxin DNA ADP-ribosyl glycohydrolase DarG [Terriglobales bacterium]
MIEYKTGDILRADVEALVNTVNCVGIMGRGIALQFREAFPANFKAYEIACKSEEVQPGRMFVFETGWLTNPKYIINFPTKRHWRGKSRIEDIESGLKALREEIVRRGIRSIAIPPLGSGLGGLDWADVRPRIAKAMANLGDVDIAVYEPNGVGDKRSARSRNVPNMTAGRAALVVLMERYLAGLMDPFVTLLEVHKLMYFMQEAGQHLKLHYSKAMYGPYAENLRHVLRTVEGHLIAGYADGGDAPNKQLELVPGAVKDAEEFLRDDEETRARFDRVAKLVEWFETPFGLELLSTVHWVAAHENAKTSEDVVSQTYAWGDRKKRFSPRQIKLAFDVLSTKGWIGHSQAITSHN